MSAEEKKLGAALEPAHPAGAAAAPAAESSALHFSAGVDFTNRYFFRGIVQERKGFLTQPWASLTVDLAKGDSWAVQGVVGTWNSFHDTATNSDASGLSGKWYECDLYGGFAATCGKWSGRAIYTFYTSPANAFETVQDITFSVSYDDSELLGAWALHPCVCLAVETGANSADGASTRPGIYFEPSINPGFTLENGVGGLFKGTAISFPIVLGLSLSDYYEDGAGSDSAFGYLSVGAKATVPLGIPKRFGDWTLNLGVQGLFLGDHTKAYNGGHSAECIGMAGVAVSF